MADTEKIVETLDRGVMENRKKRLTLKPERMYGLQFKMRPTNWKCQNKASTEI